MVYSWKPFLHCFKCCKWKWNPKTSIIKTFATFVMLSYTKLLFTSANLLYGVQVYDHNGSIIQPSPVLYYDSKIVFFSKEHAPYIVIALSVLILTMVPPLLLLLYPTKTFKKTLECCGFRRWDVLHIFMDTFQGWYKDGTKGTRDFRWVSAMYLLLRIGFVGQCMATVLLQNINQLFWVLPGIFFISLSLFYTVAQPYKIQWMNNIDGVVLAVLGINFFIFYQYYDYLVFEMVMVVSNTPLIICFIYGTYKLLKFVNMWTMVKDQLKFLLRKQNITVSQNGPGDVPYRMIHPDSYQSSNGGSNTYQPLHNNIDNYGSLQ